MVLVPTLSSLAILTKRFVILIFYYLKERIKLPKSFVIQLYGA